MAAAAALIKHSTRSGPSLDPVAVIIGRSEAPVKVPRGSQARTKGNEGAPTRSLTYETPRLSRLFSRERSFSPPVRPGADQEHGVAAMMATAVARSKLTVIPPRAERGRACCRCIGQSPAGKMPLLSGPFPSSLLRSSSSRPSRILSFPPLHLTLASPRSAPTPVGRYVAIGRSWPGSMMLALLGFNANMASRYDCR